MKNLKNLGKALNKAEQKAINGGKLINCYSHSLCPPIHEVACLVVANRFCVYEG